MAKVRALSAPPKTFGSLEIALIVAFIASHDPYGRRADPVELSERTAQMTLTVSSRSTMHKRMIAARNLGLLEIEVPSKSDRSGGWTGHCYRLGRVARTERGRWRGLAGEFFENGFVSESLVPVGAMHYDALGRDGRWLTYLLLLRAEGSAVSASEVFCAARGLLRSEQLVSRQLYRLSGLGLAEVSVSGGDGVLRYQALASPDVLAGVARKQGWTDRILALKMRIADEQLGRSMVSSQILEMRCCYCGFDGPSETFEHVPPTHWTGTKRAGLLLPACLSCNTSHGPKIRSVRHLSVGQPRPQQILQSVDDWNTLSSLSDLDLLKAFEPAFVSLVRRYRDSIMLDDLDQALSAAVDLAPIAEAVRQGYLDVVNGQTGELRTIEVPSWFPVWLARAVTETVPRAATILPI
jgi:hypothetical protein